MTANTILVFSEKSALLRELIGKARQQADVLNWTVAAIASSSDAALVGEMGADVACIIDGDIQNPDTVTANLVAAVKKLNPAVLLIGATKLGMETAPRAAERLDAGYAAWVVGFDFDQAMQTTSAQCMLYTGTGLATYRFKTGTAILTTAQGVFEPAINSAKTTSSVPLEVGGAAAQITVIDYKPKPTSGARLEEAKLVVDVGQGVKQREDLQMVSNLAVLLDGQLGCSRPIASDRDWFPEWLGLSGAKIKPELCITVGISGAIQHIVGIRDSRLVVAVNIDEGAPIFTQADYGIVADLYEFIPAFVERLKARGIKPAWKA